MMSHITIYDVLVAFSRGKPPVIGGDDIHAIVTPSRHNAMGAVTYTTLTLGLSNIQPSRTIQALTNQIRDTAYSRSFRVVVGRDSSYSVFTFRPTLKTKYRNARRNTSSPPVMASRT